MRSNSRTQQHRLAPPRVALALLVAAVLVTLVAAAGLAYSRAGAADAGRVAPRAFTLTGISPSTGLSGEGVHATITGTGFDRNGRYSVDLVNGATTLKAGSPRVTPDGTELVVSLSLADAPVGAYDVTVTDPRTSESHTLTGAFTVTASPSPSPSSTAVAPRITSVSPTKGARGAKVTIKGSGFGKPRGTAFVKFGTAKCTKYVSWANGKIVCKVPAIAKKAKIKVRVTTAAGASNSKSYTVK